MRIDDALSYMMSQRAGSSKQSAGLPNYDASDCHEIFTRVFGYSEYKGKQKEISEAAIKGADVLVVAPTGMGKSICFQVPAIVQESGITIVISPLLALMKNQIARLRRHKVHVASLTSETSKSEKREIIDDLSTPCPKNRLLYITPEKLCSAEFMKLLAPLYQRGELNRLVVDEAHCISEWGHDFREEYRRLGTIREKFPDVPLMALTASATPLVQDDIARILRMAPHRLLKFVHPFNRPNLFYEVRYHSSEGITQMDEVLNYIGGLHRRRGRPSSGIIYCRTRATCDDLSNYLQGKGLNCRPYHKGIKPAILDQTLKGWEEGGDGTKGIDVVCATIAFGMGIDKSDVRYIIHYDLPKSFEGYYQETGRAGRDGEPAKCILYYSREDMLRVRKLVTMSHTRRQATADRNNDPPPSQRAADSFSALVNFSENVNVCRHISICRYFGETVEGDAGQSTSYCENMCDVCKNPEKTRKKKEVLSPAEALDHHGGPLLPGHLEDDDGDYPVPQVRAPRVPPQPTTLGGAREKTNRTKAPRKPNPEKDDGSALPRVASTSTVLASIGTKTNYVGPALLRSRQLGLKRSISSSGDSKEDGGEEISKKPRSESSAASARYQRRTAQFRVPFKVPFSSAAASAADPRVASNSNLGPGDTISEAPKASPASKSAPMEAHIPSSDDDVEVLSSSPFNLPTEEIDLEAPFSQKIPIADRNATYTNIRRALHKVFAPSAERSNMWHKLHTSDSSEGDSKAEIRSLVLSSAAQALEFAVLSMSVSPAGYKTRSESAIKGVKRLAREDAWGVAAGQNRDGVREGKGDDWDVIKILRCASLRAKESLC
ncbi:ATP-dependent DNA helicase [Lactarius psammicola]|nr:ATP-dependent DNA helicase [Lactarius psammicola]